jgi:FXSXX-COOH protein
LTEEPTPSEPTPQEQIIESQVPIADLSKKTLKEVAEAEGDTALERTLKRLQDEVETPREAVSGFSSAV